MSHISVVTVKSFDRHFLDRCMTVEECRMMCSSDKIPLREKLFFRLLYETMLQPLEVLNLRIENWNQKYELVTAIRVTRNTKPLKGNFSKKVWLPTMPKTRIIGSNTNEMIKEYVGKRKKGPIFINNQTGGMLTLSWFNKEVNRYAELLGIQKIEKYFKDKVQREKPRTRKLVTLMALRKAGKQRNDIKGGI